MKTLLHSRSSFVTPIVFTVAMLGFNFGVAAQEPPPKGCEGYPEPSAPAPLPCNGGCDCECTDRCALDYLIAVEEAMRVHQDKWCGCEDLPDDAERQKCQKQVAGQYTAELLVALHRHLECMDQCCEKPKPADSAVVELLGYASRPGSEYHALAVAALLELRS